MCQTPAKHCTYKDAYDPHPGPEAHSTQGPCSLHSCLLALRGSLSLAFFSVPLPEIPGLPPVLLWERAQQKATMVAMRTRKATPAPTATPMMTAIGTDSVGEKQAQLTRGPTAHSPPGPHPVPSGAAPAKLVPDHGTQAPLGSARGTGSGVRRHRQNPTGSAQVGHGVGEREGGFREEPEAMVVGEGGKQTWEGRVREGTRVMRGKAGHNLALLGIKPGIFYHAVAGESLSPGFSLKNDCGHCPCLVSAFLLFPFPGQEAGHG